MESKEMKKENSESPIQNSELVDVEKNPSEETASSNTGIMDKSSPEIQQTPSLNKAMLPPAPKSSMLPPAPKRVVPATGEKEVGYTKPDWSGCPPAEQFPYFFEVINALTCF
jgi:hypothetical protein